MSPPSPGSTTTAAADQSIDAPCPSVSVVIPTRDRVELLVETIRSITDQTLQSWEVLLVDDGSKDLGRVQEVASGDPRIRLLLRRDPPAGANRCRNLGLAAARAELVMFLDSDDLLSPACLQERVRAMAEHPGIDAGIFPHRLFRLRPGDMSEVWPAVPDQDDIARYLNMDIPWQTAGPTWRRHALARLGPWDERLTCWQDWEFHLRALARGLSYRCFAGPWFESRVVGTHRESIGGRRRTPADIASQQAAILSILDLLRAEGKFTPARREALIARYLFTAELMRSHSRAEALRLWREALDARLLTRTEHVAGSLVLRLWRVRPARAAARRALLRLVAHRSLPP